MTDPNPAGIPDPRAGTAAIRRFGFMQDKHVHNNKPGPRRGGDDEATQQTWVALDYDGRGGRALDEDAAAREETAAEEMAVAAGEAAGIGDMAATVDVAAAAVEEDDERGRWAGDTSLSSADAAAGVYATGRNQGRQCCSGNGCHLLDCFMSMWEEMS